MTPLDFAQSLSKSDILADRAMGAAIVLRGLTDDDPHDATRQGWPLNADTAARAIRWLGLAPDPDLIAATLATAPTLPDAILNQRPAMTATAAPLLDCGHPQQAHATDGQTGRTYCYPCAGDHEAKAFAIAADYLAYDTGKPELTTWTGRTLARVTERRTSRNGASHGRWGYGVTYLRARGPDGSEWWGRHSIDCECVTLHRCKGNGR